MMKKSDQNKIALATGASRGIGRATALALANGGRKEIEGAGRMADIVSADLAAPDGAAELAKKVPEIAGDKLDTLVANAGISKAGIRVNAVAPGVIETDMSNFTKTEAGRDLALSMQALKRIGQPSDAERLLSRTKHLKLFLRDLVNLEVVPW